jgi:lipopolysaccharide transport system permease protein
VIWSRRWRHLFDVVLVLVTRDQRSRFSSTLFGVVWAVASPALYLLTFYFLFRVVLPLGIPNYAAHLFIGLIAWIWLQTSTIEAVGSIVGNSSLINQPGFPRVALPAVAAASNLLTMILTTPLLVIILFVSDTSPGWTLLSLPAILTVQLCVVLAIGYFVAALNVPFRDLQYIVPIVLQLGYFATPIFYDVAALPERALRVLSLNPMLHVIEAYRDVLMRGEWPDWIALTVVLLVSLVALGAALVTFRHASLRFLEDL